VHCLESITHYSSGALIPEFNGLSQFKDNTGGSSVPVREINLTAYLPLVQPTDNHSDLDLNPGGCSRQPVRPSNYMGPHDAVVTSTMVITSSPVYCPKNQVRKLLIVGTDHKVPPQNPARKFRDAKLKTMNFNYFDL